MAKRKSSTALFEVMAAHRARQQAAATQAAGQPTGQPEPAAPPRVRPTPVSRPVLSRPAATRSYSPPPGQLVEAPAGPGLVEKGKQWLATWMEKQRRRREEAAAMAAAEADERGAEAADDRSDDEPDPTAGVTARSLFNRPAPRPAAPAPVAHDEFDEPTVDHAADSLIIDQPVANPGYGRPAATERSSVDTTTLKPNGKNHVAIDRDRHEVTVKVRFTTAAISVTALLVVIGSAYILGKRVGQPSGPNTANGPTTKKAQPGVLDPSAANRTRQAQRPPAAGTGDARQAAGRQPAGESSASINPSGTTGPTEVRATGPNEAPIVNGVARRTPGLNYMVISPFKYENQDWAVEVCKYLNENGIGCTIETGNSRLGSTGDYVLVGTLGFNAGYESSIDYVGYTQMLGALAEQFPQTHKFSRAQVKRTMMYKWRE